MNSSISEQWPEHHKIKDFDLFTFKEVPLGADVKDEFPLLLLHRKGNLLDFVCVFAKGARPYHFQLQITGDKMTRTEEFHDHDDGSLVMQTWDFSKDRIVERLLRRPPGNNGWLIESMVLSHPSGFQQTWLFPSLPYNPEKEKDDFEELKSKSNRWVRRSFAFDEKLNRLIVSEVDSEGNQKEGKYSQTEFSFLFDIYLPWRRGIEL